MIIIYISNLQGGGAEKNAYLLAKLLFTRGINLIIVYENEACPSEFNRFRKFNLSNGFSLIKNIRFIRGLAKFIKLALICRRERVELIVSYLSHSNIKSIIIAKIIGIKNISMERNNFCMQFKNSSYKKFIEFLYKYSDRLIVNHYESAAYFSKTGLSNVSYVGNLGRLACVPVGPYINNGLHANKTYRVLLIARAAKQKRVKESINLFCNLPQSTLPMELVVVGEVDYATRELFKRFHDIHFFDFSDNPREFFESSDFLFLWSDYEGTPNIVLEALESGTLPILFDDLFVAPDLNGLAEFCYLVERQRLDQLQISTSSMVEKLIVLRQNQQRIKRRLEGYFNHNKKEILRIIDEVQS